MSIKVGDKVRVKGFHVSVTEYENMIGIVEALGEEIALVKINDRPIKIPLWQLVKVEEPQESEPKRGDEITLTRDQYRLVVAETIVDFIKESNVDDAMFATMVNATLMLGFTKAESRLFGELTENA